MSDWQDNKGLGPWNFTEQKDKWGYLNNPRWSNSPKAEGDSMSATEFSQGKGLPIGPDDHMPCGHWHKRPIVEEEETIEPLFITDGLLTNAGIADLCFKKTKALVFLDYYGGSGYGIDQLFCVQGCTVDAEYLWIADGKNYRIDVRKKSDLTYVNNYIYNGTPVTGRGNGWIPHDVAVDLLKTYEAASKGNLYIRSKTNPTDYIKYTIEDTDGISDDDDVFYGVAVDATHIYLTVFNNSGRVYKINKSTMVTEAEWGYPFNTISDPNGLVTNSNYLFVASGAYNRVEIYEKVPSLASVGYIGHEYRGALTDGMFDDPTWVAANDSYLYVTEPFGYRVQRFNAVTFAYIDTLDRTSSIDWDNLVPGTIYTPKGIAADATHLYIADYGTYMVSKYTTDFTFVDWVGDPTGEVDFCTDNDALSRPSFVAVDNTYLYIYEARYCSGNNKGPRIQKRLKSDLSYVDSYEDVHYNDPAHIFEEVVAMTTDGTYIYLLDKTLSAIFVISCATMTLSATHSGMNDIYDADGMWVDGTNLYLTDNNINFHGSINIWDTTNLAGGIQSYTFDGPTWGDFLMAYPIGITVDEDYIYVCATYTVTMTSIYYNSSAIPSYSDTVHRLLKINKTSGALEAYQDEFTWGGATVNFKGLNHVDCDENYLYVTDNYYDVVVILNRDDLSFVAAAGGDGLDYQDLYKNAYGICTYWNFDGSGQEAEELNEPQIWTMPGE